MFLIKHSAPFVKPSVTSTFVVKSYFALAAIEVSEYKLIFFLDHLVFCPSFVS